MNREFYISSKLSDIEVLAQRAKVMIEDVTEGYFGESLETSKNTWKIGSPFYEKAGTKADIVNDIIFELIAGLSNLRSVLEAEGDDVEQEIRLYDFMDKHNCDREVAELLLRNGEE